LKIFTDGSYKDGSIGMGLVVLNHDVLLRRKGWRAAGVDSAEAEIAALEEGLSIAISMGVERIYSDAKWLDIYTSGKRMSRKYNMSRLLNNLEEFNGEIVWIPRKDNRLADGLARASLMGIPWENEILVGRKLKAVPLVNPGHFEVNGHIVNRKSGRWYCDCKLVDKLGPLKLPCRHIYATRLVVNEITQAGELV
jgi:hypothetical protein